MRPPRPGERHDIVPPHAADRFSTTTPVPRRSARISRRAFLEAGLTTLLVAGSALAVAHADEPTRRVVVFGNSILHGVGASSAEAGCANRVAAALGGRVDGAAQWVGSTSTLLGHLPGLLTGSSPALVLVHSTTRDRDDPVEPTVARTQAIVAQIRAAWTAGVVVLGPWAAWDDHPLDLALAAGLAGRAPFVSLAPVWMVDELRSGGDEFHPNDRGHAEIARRIIPVSRAVIPTATATSTRTATATATPTRTATPTMIPVPLPTKHPEWSRSFFPVGER